MPNKPAKSACTLHSDCPEGSQHLYSRDCKRVIEWTAIHTQMQHGDMGCPFRNCLTSCSRSEVKNSNVL